MLQFIQRLNDLVYDRMKQFVQQQLAIFEIQLLKKFVLSSFSLSNFSLLRTYLTLSDLLLHMWGNNIAKHLTSFYLFRIFLPFSSLSLYLSRFFSFLLRSFLSVLLLSFCLSFIFVVFFLTPSPSLQQFLALTPQYGLIPC